MKLTNTASGQKEELKPLDPQDLRLYVCGPTVYDFAHLGHARCYIVYDVLVRHLRASGQGVTYVRNVTDIDDKIINRASETGTDPVDLAARFAEAFSHDMDRLHCLTPDKEPRVSDHLEDIRQLIARLIEGNKAYASDGDVYFHVPSFANYGKLSHRQQDALETGASGRTDDTEAARKKHPSDFALWKGVDEKAPGWESPWGRGRPGWHIECSAMSMKHLGESLDIHGGGLDLVFPHHENEIAQSEGATGKPYVGLWMHNGFVQVNKEKMSKSLGNFFGVRDVFDKVEPEAVRLGMFTVHYRSPLNLDWTVDDAGQVTGFPLFEEAEQRLEYLYETKARLEQIPPKRQNAPDAPAPQELENFEAKLCEALDDDLNMPVALAHTIEFLRATNAMADKAMAKGGKIPASWMSKAEAGLAAISRHMGIGEQSGAEFLLRVRDRRAAARGIDRYEVEGLIEARNEARKARDFTRADTVRDELSARGVKIFDGPEGTTWKLA